MNALRQILAFGLLLVPVVVLGYFGMVQFLDGWAVDGAVPVPTYMIARTPVSQAAYEHAAAALARANPRNGDAAIMRSEANLDAGAPSTDQISILTQGLTREPASARGWTLLAGVLAPSDKAGAARALSQALVLAPYDYWLVEPRAQGAALIWSSLDPDTQLQALVQARMLWEEPMLRSQLRQLLKTQEGVQFVTRAFAGRPDEVRSMNRWLSLDRQQNPDQP